MSKLNAKKTTTPKSTTTPKTTTKEKKNLYAGMSKPQRLDVTLAAVERGLVKAEQKTRKYVLADALACIARAAQEVAKAREFIIALPADWTPPKATHAAKADKPVLAVGAMVSVREKHAAKYAEFMPTANLFVTRAVNGKVMLKAEDGTNYGPIPRGHLCIDAAATERAAAEDATPAA